MPIPTTYTFETIKTILLAYGFKDNSDLSFHQPNEAKPPAKVEAYFYPFRDLASLENLLLEDNVAYFRAKRGKIGPRRVCFLLGTVDEPLALLVQWDGSKKLNSDQLNRLYRLLEVEAERAQANSPSVRKQLKNLYGRLDCIILGSLPNDTLIKKLKPAVENAIESNEVKLDFVPLPELYPHVVLVEKIFLILTKGDVDTKIDAEEIFTRQYQFCTAMLFTMLDSMEKKPSYPKILAALIQLTKYKRLTEKRAVLFKEFNESSESIDQEYLEDLLDQDAQNKMAIARTPQENVNEYLNHLDWEFLIELLQIQGQKGSEEFLLKKLIEAKEHCYRQMRVEEGLWKRYLEAPTGWGPYLRHYAERAVRYVYKKTLFHFSNEAVHRLGQFFAPRIKVGKKGALILKLGRAGLSLGLNYIFGFRVIIIASITLIANQIVGRVSRWWEGEGISQEKADFILPRKGYLWLFLNPVNLLSLLVLGKDLNDAISFRNMLYFMRFSASLLGRIMGPILARIFIPSLRYPSGTFPTESQSAKLSLFGMGGFAVGYGIGNVALKLSAIGDLHSAITSYRVPIPYTLVMGRPNIATRPGLWFDDQNPVRFTWPDITEDYSCYLARSCSIQGMSGIAFCDPVVEIPLPLASPYPEAFLFGIVEKYYSVVFHSKWFGNENSVPMNWASEAGETLAYNVSTLTRLATCEVPISPSANSPALNWAYSMAQCLAHNLSSMSSVDTCNVPFTSTPLARP